MADFHGKLGRKQEEAIIAVLSTRTVEEAARACNTPPRTLYRWQKEPAFDKAFQEARRRAFGQATARLQHGASVAATTLLKVMLDTATPASTKVRAAQCVLTHAAKAIELEDIEARVSERERAADETSKRK